MFFDPVSNPVGFVVSLVGFILVVTVGSMILFSRISGGLSAGAVKNGVMAPATILKTWDTGTTINDNPVVGFALDVHPQNEPAFQAEMKQLVSRIQIGAFLPGQSVQVMYDPANHKKIKIQEVGAASGMGGMAMPAAAVEAMQQTLLAQDKMYEAVRSMGQAAEATILKVTDMNIQVGDTATMKKLDVEVKPADRPSFHAVTQGAISIISNDKYQPGKTIWVKFNPNDMTQVAIDHS
jgi:hypothetical protein